MNESAQQAISIGVNLTIFVVALTISLNLIFSVRELVNISKEVEKSVPDGSMQEVYRDIDFRIVNGYELVSYYHNYIKPYYTGTSEVVYNHPKFHVEIIGNDTTFNRSINDDLSIRAFINGISLNSKYKLSITKYNQQTNITNVKIEKID